MPAPDVYGLTWVRSFPLLTADGPVTAHVAERPTPEFEAAIEVARKALADAGLRMVSGDWSRHGLGKKWWRGAMCWEPEGGVDPAALAAAMAEAAVTPAQRQAREDAVARQEEEGRRAWDVMRARSAVDALREAVEVYPWALAADRDAAERVVAAGDLGDMHPEAALEIARRAGRVYKGQCRRMREWPMDEVYVAQAERPGVLAAVHQACRYLTDLDADRAQQRNRRGWSPATTFAGHLLAGMALDEIGLREAVYGLELVNRHRRQLPPALAATLFADLGKGFAL